MQEECNGLVLWHRFRLGEATALEKLMMQNFKVLYRYGTKFSKDDAFIKDCIQDLFLDLWSHRQSLSEAIAVKAYLLASLRRRLNRGLHSKKWVANESFDSATVDFEVEFSVEDSLIREEQTRTLAYEIKAQLDQLPKRQQEVIYLKYYENLSRDEIAEVMGINAQSVSNLLQAAYKFLKANWKTELFIFFAMGVLC